MAVFLVVFYGFDRFVVWSERFDRFPSAIGTGPSFTRVVGDVSY